MVKLVTSGRFVSLFLSSRGLLHESQISPKIGTVQARGSSIVQLESADSGREWKEKFIQHRKGGDYVRPLDYPCRR